jgi:hypothetical protein
VILLTWYGRQGSGVVTDVVELVVIADVKEVVVNTGGRIGEASQEEDSAVTGLLDVIFIVYDKLTDSFEAVSPTSAYIAAPLSLPAACLIAVVLSCRQSR